MYDLDKKLNKISMIGFMATGKTKNSILLSQLLDRPAIDSDEMIVEKENKTIPEIFENTRAIF
ncbi:MAG: hypothetical protein IPO21_21645 [Bacteroidales bacterium]|nr:hypothetical protein [Bacteroidales bacterium]